MVLLRLLAGYLIMVTASSYLATSFFFGGSGRSSSHAFFQGEHTVGQFEFQRELHVICLKLANSPALQNYMHRGVGDSIRERCSFLQDFLSKILTGSQQPLSMAVSLDQLVKHAHELHLLVRSQFIGQEKAATATLVDEYVEISTDLRTLTNSIESLKQLDRERRQGRLDRNTQHALRLIKRLQEPLICQYSSKVLVCQGEDLNPDNKEMEFGDRLNYAVLCLAAATASEQRLILQKVKHFWLQDLVESVNLHCDYEDQKILQSGLDSLSAWPNKLSPLTELFTLPFMPHYKHFGPRMPPHIPENVGSYEEMLGITTNPSAWYAGVLTKFLLDLTPNVQQRFRQRARGLRLDPQRFFPGNNKGREEDETDSSPAPPMPMEKAMAGEAAAAPLESEGGDRQIVAGIHVVTRPKMLNGVTTARVWAAMHYMWTVEEFFLRCDLRAGGKQTVPRRVFVSTDDMKVIQVIQDDFSQYQVIFNVTQIKNFHQPQKELNHREDQLFDLLVLAKVDFFVGTLSSTLSRTAYQLRFAEIPDAWVTTYSLDLQDWYLTGMAHNFEHTARADQNPAKMKNGTILEEGHLTFKKGDRLKSLQLYGLVNKVNWDQLELPVLPYGIDVGGLIDLKTFGLYPKFRSEIDLPKLIG